ncbi:cytochrome P450 family protein [Kutzneria kofuensis]|uniref:Cytochrome P450 n=1 Tax=Kutzneria kofuensis TaxID=103725 RepID=A0A7W9NJM2_9PSEU|nr:cytochrome P450 [Kutzneria kofuensis]MBB5895777.1 cytochrome P450 [Kutzneria kofuensis]
MELDKAWIRDPWPLYRELRRQGPLRRVVMPDGVPGWLVTDHAEARALLDDRRLSKNVHRARELFPPGTAGGYITRLSEHMLNDDPPNHTRLRKLVTKAFTSRAVNRLRPQIERITDELLDGVDGETDLIESFAFPLPIAVISELLGVPHEDRSRIRAWSRVFVSGVTGEPLATAAREQSALLRDLIRAKRAEPAEDLLSDLVHVSDEGDRLSEDELVAMAFLLLFAGHETTVHLLGNAVYSLLRNPEQERLLRTDPSLLPGAIEEFLRTGSPIHIATLRFTTEPVTVGDVEIPAGEFVMVSLLAANADEARFEDPYELDITRPAGGHLAFGHGIHYCLGAPLARLEGEIAIGRLLARFPSLRLAVDPADLHWRTSTLVRGLRELPVIASTRAV